MQESRPCKLFDVLFLVWEKHHIRKTYLVLPLSQGLSLCKHTPLCVVRQNDGRGETFFSIYFVSNALGM